MTDAEKIEKLEEKVQQQEQEIAYLRYDLSNLSRKWSEFEREMARLAKNPWIIENQVRQQLRARGIPC